LTAAAEVSEFETVDGSRFGAQCELDSLATRETCLQAFGVNSSGAFAIAIAIACAHLSWEQCARIFEPAFVPFVFSESAYESLKRVTLRVTKPWVALEYVDGPESRRGSGVNWVAVVLAL
jgi:hypothetical protein